jgi:16S rRNA C967 or C1407 C5-methylase (RsmB/RsmF family)
MKKLKTEFESYYQEMFGERWIKLKTALLEDKPKNEYTNLLLKPYFLNSASVTAALALGIGSDEKILDMCAAPGGKSLVLASLMPASSVLICNERSKDRYYRLVKVLDEHLPEEIRSRVKTFSRDASRWCLYEKEEYDRILLDAPCSSEEHVLKDAQHLKQWSLQRIKTLAIAQYALLSSALLCLKPGGTIVYSTCALSHAENDAVIEKLLKKHKNIVRTCNEDNQWEKTEYGYQIWPDVFPGSGPIYFSRLIKTGSMLNK